MSETQMSQGARKIVIDPVTRVEGHGKVTIRLNAAGEVEQARFHIRGAWGNHGSVVTAKRANELRAVPLE